MDEIEARVAALEGQLHTRMSALEDQVKAIRSDAAAARVLAGGADRDVAEFHAKLDTHKALLDALRENQVELHDTQVAQGERLEAQNREMRSGFAKLTAGQAEITTLLTTLIDREN
jgi:uncharacterized coiled-coil DUF342 family protein